MVVFLGLATQTLLDLPKIRTFRDNESHHKAMLVTSSPLPSEPQFAWLIWAYVGSGASYFNAFLGPVPYRNLYEIEAYMLVHLGYFKTQLHSSFASKELGVDLG